MCACVCVCVFESERERERERRRGNRGAGARAQSLRAGAFPIPGRAAPQLPPTQQHPLPPSPAVQDVLRSRTPGASRADYSRCRRPCRPTRRAAGPSEPVPPQRGSVRLRWARAGNQAQRRRARRARSAMARAPGPARVRGPGTRVICGPGTRVITLTTRVPGPRAWSGRPTPAGPARAAVLQGDGAPVRFKAPLPPSGTPACHGVEQ